MPDRVHVTPAIDAADLKNALEQLKVRSPLRTITDDEAERLLQHALADLSCGHLSLTPYGWRALAELDGPPVLTDEESAAREDPRQSKQTGPTFVPGSSSSTIGRILASEAAIASSSATSVKELFRAIGNRVRDLYRIDAASVVDALWTREIVASTAICGGVAIPHGRLSDIDEPLGIFVRLNYPIDFGAADGQGVDLVFAVLSPLNSQAAHLIALARVSRLLCDGHMRERIRSTTEHSALYTLITEPSVH